MPCNGTQTRYTLTRASVARDIIGFPRAPSGTLGLIWARRIGGLGIASPWRGGTLSCADCIGASASAESAGYGSKGFEEMDKLNEARNKMKEMEEILNRLHEHADFREMFLFERALNDAEALFIRLIKENECLNGQILEQTARNDKS